MRVGDLVVMKGTRYHKEIGVVTLIAKNKKINHIKVHWADGRVLWEQPRWLKAMKKNP